jgi:hypothetical protein
VKLAPAGSDIETTVKVKVFNASASVALTWNLRTCPASTFNDWQEEFWRVAHVDGTNIWGPGLKTRTREVL